MSAFDGSVVDDAMAKFREAAAAATIPSSVEPLALKDSTKRSGTTVDVIRRQPKRKVLSTFSNNNKMIATDHSSMLSHLNNATFSLDRSSFKELGYAAILDKSQAHLLEVMSACHHVKMELDAAKEESKSLRETMDRNLRDRETEIKQRDSEIVAKQVENVSLKNQVDNLTNQLATMSTSAEKLQQKLNLAVPAATIHCQRKMVQEFKRGCAKDWDAEKIERAYREIVITEAKIDGKPIPTFPEALTEFEDVVSTSAT